MSSGVLVYRRWMRDRWLSTAMWTLGNVIIIVATAAFYPALSTSTADSLTSGGEAMSSLLGLSAGIDPTSPLGYLWIGLYANIVPWVLMALGIALGTAAIAGDEDTGVLEYMLARPITRTAVILSRFAGVVTVLFVVAAVSALSLIICIPIFELGDSVTTTAPDGSMVTAPGATASDIVAGTLAAFAIGMGSAGVAFFLGGLTGRKGLTLGASSAVAIGGYVLYTLSNMTSSLEWLTWLSPWRWYIDDVMLINGLDWEVVLPFITALVGLVLGWIVFVRRDLQNP